MDNTAYYSILRTTLENQRADSQKIPFADMELKFIQLEECHTSNGSSHRERANLAALNPNPLAASNRRNGKPKPKGGSRFVNRKKVRSSNSSGDGKPIVCFGCYKPGHKKSECPERKEGNTANAGATRGHPVAMATQETHYASMVQLVESSLALMAIERESKRLRLRTASDALFIPSVWMMNFHRQQLGGAREWLNLIKLTVPVMVSLGPPHPQTDPYVRYNYHRDIFSPLALDINATIADFDLKTWGFLVYLDDYDEETNPFDLLMKRILHKGIIPLATSYFQSFFTTPGPAQQVYCHRYKEFVNEHLKDFSSSWRLTECLVGIRIQGLQVEVLFYPLRQSPKAWEVGSLRTIADFPSFGPFEQGHGGPSAEFFENMNRICYMWMTHSDDV
jgi:hypothetical protein